MAQIRKIDDAFGGLFSVEGDRGALADEVTAASCLDRLRTVAADEERPASEKVGALLRLGRDWLGGEQAHLARIDVADGTHTVVDVSGPHPIAARGQTRALPRTYCRTVLAEDAVLALADAPADGWEADPAYDEFRARTYLGSKVVVDGSFYGTLSVVDREARDDPFTRAEVAGVRLLADTVGAVLSEGPTASSPQPTPAQLNALFASSPNMINIHDREGTLIAPNPRLCEKTGYTKAELTGMKVWELDREATPERARPFWDEMEPGDRARWEGAYRRKDGTTFPVEVDLRCLDVAGEPRFIATSRDITERKEAQDAVRQSEHLHRETLRNMTDTVLIAADDGTLTYVCPNVEHIFGCDRQAAEAHGTISALLGGDPAGDRDLDERGELRNVEWRITDAEGAPHDLLINVRRVEIQGGTRMYTCRDTTARKRRERQLEAVFNQTYQFTGLLEPGGTVIAANDSALQFGGLDEEDVVGTPIWDTDWFQTEEASRERLRAAVERAADGEFVRYEETVKGVEGTRVIDFSLRPVTGEGGEIRYIIPEGRDITDRKETERELQNTKRLLEKTFESLSEAVLVIDPSERAVIACNAAVEDVFGYEKEELIGECTKELHTSPAAYEHFGDISEPVLDEEGVFRHQYQMQRKEGTIIDTEHVVTPLRDEKWPEGVVSIIRDITERKEALEQLREEHDLLSRIFETSPAAIVVLDAEGEFVEVSNRAKDVLGLEKSEVTDRTYDDPAWDIRGPEGGPMPDEALPFNQVLRTDAPVYDVEHQIAWPDGTHRLLSVSGAPLHSSDGELEGVVFHLDDITERRAAQKALQKERDRFATLFHNLPTPVVRGGPDDEGRIRIEAVNERFEDVFGYEEDDILGDDLQELIVPDERTPEADAMRDRLLAGAPVNREVRRRAADGFRDFRVQVALPTDSDSPTEGFAIYTDVTERKERERTLARRKALLEAQAEATLDGLLAVDTDRRAVFYNDRFLEIWTLPTESFDGEHRAEAPVERTLLEEANDLLPDPDTFWEEVEYLYDHPGQESRNVLRLTDGRWIDRYSASIVGDDGARFGRLWVFRDVTEQRRMVKRLLEVQEEERRRIDQEIHDEMGGLLTSLQFAIDFARQTTPMDDASIDHFDRLEDLVSELSTVSRTISRKLYPNALSKRGLAETFPSLVDQLEKKQGLSVDLYSEIEPGDRFSVPIERTVYWIVQEILMGIARHDDVESAQVIVNKRGEQLYLHLFDEGAGLTSATPDAKTNVRLQTVRRRVEWLDGEMRIDPISGEGVRLSIILPVRLPFLSR